MARNFVCGFELGSLAEVSPTSGNVSIEFSIVRSGRCSLKVTPASGATAGVIIPIAINSFYRMYIRVITRPVSTARLIQGGISASRVNLRLNPDGTIAFYNNTTLIGTSTTALTDVNKWYRVEWRVKDGSSVVVLRIDGNDEVSGSPSSWIPDSDFGCTDTVADTYTVYYDDICSDDTDFPGPGADVMLLPVSDNARTTQWTGGAGGTSNLFDAVNNIPPTGTVSASATDFTQIEHAGGATGTYSANMGAYSDSIVSGGGGMGIGDVVNAVQYIVVWGEDIATGTKLLAIAGGSNPVVPQSSSFDVFPASGAVGNFPTNWTIKKDALAIQTNPSVVLGTKPIMRVVRPETATRVASVCFMGMYVDYTPASSSIPGSESDFIQAKSSQIVSVNRASFY